MNLGIFTAILLFCIFSYFFGQTTAKKLVTNQNLKLKTLPTYYGYFVALWCGIPSLILFAVWSLFEPTIIKTIVVGKVLSASQIEAGLTTNLIYQKILSYSSGNFTGDLTDTIKIGALAYAKITSLAYKAKLASILSLASIGFIYAFNKVSKNNNARNDVENILKWLLFSSSVIAILTTLGIIFSLLFESIKFFSSINIFDFLFGTNWSPQKAFVRDASAITAEEYLEIKDAFGSVPLFAGTAFIALIAMCVAVPIGLFSGIYLAEYASYKSRRTIKPIIEILAGIPTVVYGFFAALTVGPFFREFGESLGLNVSSESALAAGLVMGIMIIPYVSSLSDDVINAVPQSLREGSYAVGATKSETIKKVVFPAALPGIIGSILLAVSRAIGETMIVVMAAGLAANLTINPLESTTTVTTQIVMLLVGDQEFDSPKTQSAFALGLTLFLVTLVLNYIALRVVKKYREKYD